MVKKVCRIWQKEKIMLPNEEGDAVREYKEMHEEKYGAIG